jgi:small neutral amino acid transporter SnatA (MarC family)
LRPIHIEINPLTTLLHGAGGAYDELIIFGGIGLLLVGVGWLSWRASKEKERRKKARRDRKSSN